MLKLNSFLHRIASVPRIYDWIQILVGIRLLQHRLSAHISQLEPTTLIVDVGGGTGLYRDLWPQTVTYICCDIDIAKLRGFRSRHSSVITLLADATRTPIKAGTADIIVCTSVAHHIDDESLHQVLCEGVRLLKPGGKLILAEPLWIPHRLAGRLLWSMDRGAYPRTEEALHAAISEYLMIIHWDCFSLLHTYVIAIAGKPV